MRFVSILLLILGTAILLTQCGSEEPRPVVLYTGRNQSLVDPLIEQFRKNTDLRLEVRYGDAADLAAAAREEGELEDGDLFWASNAATLEALDADRRFATLPDSLLYLMPGRFRSSRGTWVATSVRARVLAFARERVDTTALPKSLSDLVHPLYEGRVGFVPESGTFQAHVTALRVLIGDDSTQAWLAGMQQNGTKSYLNDPALLQAIADGEVDFGLTDHHYLFRSRSRSPGYPVGPAFFSSGDPGNLLLVSGIGLLATTERKNEALLFVSFLTSIDAQQFFARETLEYPVHQDVEPDASLPPLHHLDALVPAVASDSLMDLEGTLDMLRAVGLLPAL